MHVARNREVWPDAVKIVACILVVLGHFTQSMVKAGIMPADDLYFWFQMTIYTFHVPLFFICSGYLYQRFTYMESASDWWFNVRKKLLVLGVPYFVFTGLTLVMKAVAGASVNDAVEYDALETLFLHPTAPYWYLYALFFMFLVTPVTRNIRGITVAVAVACIGKAMSISGMAGDVAPPFFISTLLANEIWFVTGMGVARFCLQERLGKKETLLGLAFLPLSAIVYVWRLGQIAEFCLGMLACLCVVSGSIWFGRVVACSRLFQLCRDETMPIYLMHTICAAPIRIMLLKAGVISSAPHVALGLAACFIGPSFAMWLMEKLRPLDFVVYPNRYIKLTRKA